MRAVILIGLFLLSAATSPAAYYLFATNAAITNGDLTYEGYDLEVDNCTLTVDGSHSFQSLVLTNAAVLTHPYTSTLEVHSLDLTIAGSLVVATNASIDVRNRGFVDYYTSGNSTNRGATGGGGGSYGGLGYYESDWSPGWVYGDFRNPVEPGAGGAGDRDSGGLGGGLIRIAAGTLQIDGWVCANGEEGHDWAWRTGGGGAGGGIRLDAGLLRGTGLITANGGDKSLGTCAGGGGRVAVYYAALDGFDITHRITACGGTGGGKNGAPGTVYLKDTATGADQLRVSSHGQVSGSWTPLGATGDTVLVVNDLEMAGTNVVVAPEHNLPFQVQNLAVMDGAILTHQGTDPAIVYGLEITVTNLFLVDPSSSVKVNERGFRDHYTTGNTTNGGARMSAGGSYGGLGYWESTWWPGWVYGDFRNPVEPGAGGAGDRDAGGNGGGLVRIAAGTAQIDGTINARGGDGLDTAYRTGGGGAGGGIRLDAGTLAGSGWITANGGDKGNGTAGGGGGRVAVYYTVLDGFDITNRIAALGGTGGGKNAAPGTVYVKNVGGGGTLRISSQGQATGVYTPLGCSTDTVLGVEDLVVSGTNVLVLPEHEMPVEAHSIAVSAGGRLLHQGVNPSQEYTLQMTVAHNVTIDASSSIDVSSQGYRDFYTHGNTTYGGATSESGGSYGGLGKSIFYPGWDIPCTTGYANQVYGDYHNPREIGSGGAGERGSAGNGGGLIRLTCRQLQLDGAIRARGEDGYSNYAYRSGGGGSGGGILVNAGLVAGAGLVNADGGNGAAACGWSIASGSGGGGRIAVYTWQTNLLEITNVTARGGTGGGGPGQTGSVFFTSAPAAFWDAGLGELAHDTESLQWSGLGMDPELYHADVAAYLAGAYYAVAPGQAVIGRAGWWTTNSPDGRYDVKIVFARNDNGAVAGELTLPIAVNNTLQWHTGSVAQTETWASGVVHAIEGQLRITNGVTVTVEPGAIIKCAGGGSLLVAAGGVLNAAATETAPIIFTSLRDDSVGGDSNLDGDDTLPLPGIWGGIASQGGTLNLSAYVQMRYTLTTHSGTVSVDEAWQGTVLHVITNNLTVGPNATLTINPGAIVKFDTNKWLKVDSLGTLNALGTLAQPIILTSLKDDTVGGDSNNDGTRTQPAAGDWSQVVAGAGRLNLQHVEIAYAGGTPSHVYQWGAGAVRTTNGAVVVMKNCVIRESLFEGLHADHGGSIHLTNTVIAGCDRAVNADGALVDLVNCTLYFNRIGLWPHGGTISMVNSIISHSISNGVDGASVIRYSNVWSPWGHNGTFTPGADGNISTNPAFKDAAGGNFRLDYLSPCIDAADGSVAAAADYAGVPRCNDPRTVVKKGVAGPGGMYPDMGAYEFAEGATSAVDLVVNGVQGPVSAMAGGEVTLSWTVANVGAETAQGPWHDTIGMALVANGSTSVLASLDVVAGTGGALGPGHIVSNSATFRVPGAVPGQYRWWAFVNARDEVFEGQNRGNNGQVSEGLVTLDVPELDFSGGVTNGAFAGAGEPLWFKITATNAQNILLALDLADAAARSEIYVARGYMPDRQVFDWQQAQWNSADTSVIIPGAADAVYYVMIYPQYLPGSGAFTLTVGTADFSLASVAPATVGNYGPVTLEINGALLDAATTFQLVGPAGQVHEAVDVWPGDASRVYARFNLTDAAQGSYDVRAGQTNGLVAVLSDGLQVVKGLGPQLQADFILPAATRLGRPFTLDVTYANVGDADLYAPVLVLTGPAGMGMGLAAGSADAVGQLQFMGYAAQGPMHILRPGQRGQVTIYCAGSVQAAMPFALDSLSVKPGEPTPPLIDWAALRANVQPPNVDAALWGATWETFCREIGATWPEVAVHLGEQMQQGPVLNHEPNILVDNLMSDAFEGMVSQDGGLLDQNAPWICAHAPRPGAGGGVFGLDVLFAKDPDPAFMTNSLPVLRNPAGGAVASLVVTQVCDRLYRFQFPEQTQAGRYQLRLGPDIKDWAGTKLDQDFYGVPGEISNDVYDAAFALRAGAGATGSLFIVAATPSAPLDVGQSVDHLVVFFNQPTHFQTFTPADVAMTGPSGSVSVLDIRQRSSLAYEVRFPRQAGIGGYSFTIGPAILDLQGHAMDQNLNGVYGEVPGDQFTAGFRVRDTNAPYVVSMWPTDFLTQAVDHVDITFNKTIDITTVTTGQVAITGPLGPVPLTAIVPLAGDQYRFLFAPQSTDLTYRVRIGPDILDLYSNRMDQARDGVSTTAYFTGGFSILPGVAETARRQQRQGGDNPYVVVSGRLTYQGAWAKYFKNGAHASALLWKQNGLRDYEPGVPFIGDARDVLMATNNLWTGGEYVDESGNFRFAYDIFNRPLTQREAGTGLTNQYYIVALAENRFGYVLNGAIGFYDPNPFPLEGWWWKSSHAAPVTPGASQVWGRVYHSMAPTNVALAGSGTIMADASMVITDRLFAITEWLHFGANRFKIQVGEYPRDQRIAVMINPYGDWGHINSAYWAWPPWDYIALGSNEREFPNSVLHEYGHSIQCAVNGYQKWTQGGGDYGIINESDDPPQAYCEGWASFFAAKAVEHIDVLGNLGVIWPMPGVVGNTNNYMIGKNRDYKLFEVNNYWMGFDGYGFANNNQADESVINVEYLNAYTPSGRGFDGVNNNANQGDLVLGGVCSVFRDIMDGMADSPDKDNDEVANGAGFWRAFKAAANDSTLMKFYNEYVHNDRVDAIFIDHGNPVRNDNWEGSGGQTADDPVDLGELSSTKTINRLVMAEPGKGTGDWFKVSIPASTDEAHKKDFPFAARIKWTEKYGDLDLFLQCQDFTAGTTNRQQDVRYGGNATMLRCDSLSTAHDYEIVVGAVGHGALMADWSTTYGGDYVPDYSMVLNTTIPPAPKTNDHHDATTKTNNASGDPNEIVGPAGSGPQRWISVDYTLPYTIHFENLTNATAPAQTVIVTAQLSTNLDWTSFRWTGFQIGTNLWSISNAVQNYTARLDLRGTCGLYVDVAAALTPSNGALNWTFTGIDPNTGQLTEDPLGGFLPPNTNAPAGEGAILYSVRPRTNAAEGAVLDAQARIVFDVNDPIDTPAIFNTLDFGPPVSQVTALPDCSPPWFTVHWSGHDFNGSGIAGYDIYVSKDGGDFLPWLVGTTDTSASYVGQVGSTYAFFSAATDQVGYREARRMATDTSTRVSAGLPWVQLLLED